MCKLLIVFVLFLFAIQCGGTGPSKEETARVLAHTYVLATPISSPEALFDYVQENREYFVKNGPAIRLARALGNRLIREGVGAYDPNAFERAMGVGPAEFAPDVARSLNEGAYQALAMGQELCWLADVLPAVAVGDYGPYQTTGTLARQAVRQSLPYIYGMMEMLDPEIAQLYEETMNLYMPLAEDYIFMLAMMF